MQIDNIMQQKGLRILVADATELSKNDPESFSQIRKSGFGASDASILLDVNLYRKLKDLRTDKKTLKRTAEDIAIGEKPAVIKGAILEEHALNKWSSKYDMDLIKPRAMYNIRDTNLNVNFDGIFAVGDEIIPVEVKFVTKYGCKYYELGKAVKKITDVDGLFDTYTGAETLQEHIKYNAKRCGIPAYYYTQVQQQIYGLDSPYGYLTGLMENSMKLATFIVPRDERCIENLVEQSNLNGDCLIYK